MKKVSVVITCYNKGNYIQEAVESVINQTYKNLEIICVNDASKDNSQEILINLAKKYKINLIENENNRGVVYSRNTAIERSCGDYILPLDGDDTIEPEYIEKAVKVLDENPEVGVVYCKYKYFGTSNRKIELPRVTKDYLLYSCCISACSMFRKKDFLELGGYKGYMKKGCEDWELWLRFYENEYKFHLLNEYLLNYRKYKIGKRTNSASKNILDIKSQIIKNHLNLYLSEENFVDKIFTTDLINKKYRKYKKLYNILLCSTIGEALLFLFLFLVNIAR